MQRLAEQFGKGDTFHLTPVGVFFGRDGKLEPGTHVADPFFGGAGPQRTGCIECGECMTGCRHGAKNTLTTNYLYLAERNGAAHPPADHGRRRPPAHRRRLRGRHRSTPAAGAKDRPDVHRRPGRLRAGTYNTQKLLHRLRATTLPRHLDRARLPHPHQLRGAARRARHEAAARLHRGRRDHVVVASGRDDPHRAGALRQGQQRDGAAEHDPDRRRHPPHRAGGSSCSRCCTGPQSCGCSCRANGPSG